jgi:uncharacterized protein
MIPYQEPIRQFMQTRPVKRAYLFGSQARGEATPDSDVDVLVELEPGVSLFDFIRIQLDLQLQLNKPVDLVSTVGLSPYVKPYIDADKLLIYEKVDY